MDKPKEIVPQITYPEVFFDSKRDISEEDWDSMAKFADRLRGGRIRTRPFHFLVKQITDKGIASYMQRFINSYVHYLNVKYKRVGPLFQGRFKGVLVDSNEQLLHVSRYIHLNPLVSGLVSNLDNYAWSSYPVYVGNREDGLSNPNLVLDNFKTKEDYKQFVLDQEDYAKSLELLKHEVDFCA